MRWGGVFRVRVRVRVRVRGRGTYFHTHMHARQGCQACGLVRVASGLVESERVVERVAPMPHATNAQAAQFGTRHPSRMWVSLSHPVMCVWPLNSQSQFL